METFWYRLTQVHLEIWPLKRRERLFRKYLLIGIGTGYGLGLLRVIAVRLFSYEASSMKKALRGESGDANTARWLVRRSQKFCPAADLPGGAGRPKFNQLEMVTTFYLQTQFGEDRCTQSW